MSIRTKTFKRINLDSFSSNVDAENFLAAYRKSHPVPAGRNYTYHIGKKKSVKSHKRDFKAYIKWHNYSTSN